jgi:tetratricopeptide (TPR) repeat protein
MAPPAKPILYLLFPALSVLALQRNNAWSDEISLWSAAAKKSPLMPRVHVELGNALRVDGRLEAARLRYRRALELDAGHRAARTNLANIYYEEGLRAADETVAREYLLAAAKEYHQVLVSDPGYREALNSLGNVYAEAGNHAAAISYYGKTIELYPNFPEGHYNLARSLGALGRFDEALEMYRRSLALTPDDAEAHFQMGNLRVRLGDLEGGQRAYREAVDLREEVPYLYSLAEVLMAAGQGADSRAGAGALLVEAHGLYKRIERVSPDYRRVRDRLAQLGQYLHE